MGCRAYAYSRKPSQHRLSHKMLMKIKKQLDFLSEIKLLRAGDGDRTRDNHLGKVELYH